MEHEFDAIIVGAGMGGLCAAAYLIAGGKRVAVVEKSPHLGAGARIGPERTAR